MQYRLKKKMWAKIEDSKTFELRAEDYYPVYDRLVVEEEGTELLSGDKQREEIVGEVCDYLEHKW